MPARNPESLKGLSGIGRKKQGNKVIILGKTWRARRKLGQSLTKKMEADELKWHIDELDRVFSIFIRRRDKNRGCITKLVTTCSNMIEHNCHRIERKWYSHRWEERNCSGGCASCNTYHEAEHKIYYTIEMMKLYGKEFVDRELRKKSTKKPSLELLKEKILYYKQLINGGI